MSKFFTALEKAEQEGTLKRQIGKLWQETPTEGEIQIPTARRQEPSVVRQPTPEPRPKTPRSKIGVKRVVVTVLVAAICGATVYGYIRATPEVTAAASVVVKQGDFTLKLSELGQLRALESATISAQKDLPIIYLIPEGTHAKEGEILVRFDASKYQAVLEETSVALEVAQAEARKAQQDLEAQRQKLLAEIARFELEARLAQLDLDDLKKKPLPDELERVRMELEKAKATFENAEKKRNILPEFVEKGFITKSALEEADLKYIEATANLQSARFNFDKVSAGATPQELERANVRLRQARFALEKAQSGMTSQLQAFEAAVEREKANVQRAQKLIKTAEVKLGRTELEAPKDGLVVYATLGGEKSGEKVQLGMIPYEGQPILFLPDLSTIVADTEINEVDIGKVQVGSPVEVRLEAYPGTVFRGRVMQIGSLARFKQSRSGTASGIKVFDVTVKIEEKDPRLKPGLTTTLDFIVERHDDALSIPVAAVMSRQGEHIALVTNAGKIEERKVVLGPSNEHYVLVKQGLRPGERVLLSAHLSGTP
jgi:HlyD family secretion protein